MDRREYKTQWQKEDHHKQKATPYGRARVLVNGARQRAKRLGLPFSLDRNWLESKLSKKFCEVTGLPFDFSFDQKMGPWVPSLDRIEPNKGYTKENTRVVVLSYNTAKGSGTDKDVITLAKALLSKGSKK